jgi:membrane-associated protease RseP (regulator of RpoE activity)
MDYPLNRPDQELPEKRKVPYLHLSLFLLTVLTTLFAGALQQGVNPLEDGAGLLKGIPFACSLLFILGSHEFGHYYMARRNGVDATLPLFIPAPSLIGTFGAVIKMKSPIMDRRALIDIGAAGPLVGFAVTVPILITGLWLSKVQPIPSEGAISLGSSALMAFLSWMVHGPMPEGMDVVLHPLAFSGWIGLLVTALNLMPVGQLDGGHVAYALFGRRQMYLGWAFVAVIAFLGIFASAGWLVWLVFPFFVGVKHPPVVYDWVSLDLRRRLVGWLTILVFALTFTPVPTF